MSGPFVGTLSRIFLRYANRIKREAVAIAFCVPENSFVTSRESSLAMQSVLEMPYNAISEAKQVVGSEYRMERKVKGNYLTVSVYVVAHLPANAAANPQHSDTLADYL